MFKTTGQGETETEGHAEGCNKRVPSSHRIAAFANDTRLVQSKSSREETRALLRARDDHELRWKSLEKKAESVATPALAKPMLFGFIHLDDICEAQQIFHY